MGSGANEIITITSLVHSLENIVDPYRVVRHNLGLYIISPMIRLYGKSFQIHPGPGGRRPGVGYYNTPPSYDTPRFRKRMIIGPINTSERRWKLR